MRIIHMKAFESFHQKLLNNWVCHFDNPVKFYKIISIATKKNLLVVLGQSSCFTSCVDYYKKKKQNENSLTWKAQNDENVIFVRCTKQVIKKIRFNKWCLNTKMKKRFALL